MRDNIRRCWREPSSSSRFAWLPAVVRSSARRARPMTTASESSSVGQPRTRLSRLWVRRARKPAKRGPTAHATRALACAIATSRRLSAQMERSVRSSRVLLPLMKHTGTASSRACLQTTAVFSIRTARSPVVRVRPLRGRCLRGERRGDHRSIARSPRLHRGQDRCLPSLPRGWRARPHLDRVLRIVVAAPDGEREAVET
jgi:hypothetical protein